VNIKAPAIGDFTSFNRFLDLLWYRTGADSLVHPDSVSTVEVRDYAWGYSGGASYKLKKGIVGVEYHYTRDEQLGDQSGKGPRAIQWDVRSGMEYRCNDVLTGRLGYAYRWVDRDDYTKGNEYLGHTVTAGFGLRPAGASWSVETGYAIEWLRSDFGDPTNQRSSRQDLSMQIHWLF
jgi:opacity protein-like surface antigen